jgi:hypothetical protein
MDKFSVQRHSTIDKSFELNLPRHLESWGLNIKIDFDDVNHKKVNKITKKIVQILNNNLGEFEGFK